MNLVDTTHVGNTTEAAVMFALLRDGWRVSVPFGGGSPYDLLIEKENRIYRVQCKTGWVTSTGALGYHRSSETGSMTT